MRSTTEKQLVSSGEISRTLGISRTCAVKMIKSGAFGTPVQLAFAGARTHFRVTRVDWQCWLKSRNITPHINNFLST